MIRLLAPLSLIALACLGCAPRFDVFASWTIQGRPAESACQAFEAPDVHLRALNRDVAEGTATEELTRAECALQPVELSVASFADLYVDLLDGETVYGTAGPVALAPASANQGYPGDSEENPLLIDIDLQRSRLRARLTVVGQSCGDAGASSFSVSVSRNASPLEEAVVVDGESVSCQDGEAWFELAPVDIGVRYAVMATTTIDGVEYATELPGEGVVPDAALTTLDVDLDAAARP